MRKSNGTKTARHSRHTPSHYPNVAYARDPLIRCTHVRTLHQQIAIVAKLMVIATGRVAVSMLDVVVVVVLIVVVVVVLLDVMQIEEKNGVLGVECGVMWVI